MNSQASVESAPSPGARSARPAAVVLRSATATWYQDGPHEPLVRIPHTSATPGAAVPGCGRPRAVLFDRDGTLVEDVPHNTDPGRIRPRPSAREALATLRAAGVPAGVVSNQPDVGRGIVALAQLDALHARMEALVGPIAVTAVCPHLPQDGCGCRKPQPGLVLAACRVLGVRPPETAVVGDIAADLGAAHRAGATGVLVPNPATRAAETRAAPRTAAHLAAAVRALVGIPTRPGGRT
ncbi:HAD-IIIA family hydrolase [Streptomyces sp. 891-h]|uniref:D-glycero-alpha-D-manno-heptose-1,7-bisphosphate 7-phosphatase n=1 Tax=Streptomyces sp. 891-h TaxID=2720714 RepID=UPI001FA9D609|nr:HAD-IIIA family hydrolase [Streptomyces sp. 891-h]UNZ19284.1 HAD-IIIA family hydrolase [Streptomyces sp. 891-h]